MVRPEPQVPNKYMPNFFLLENSYPEPKYLVNQGILN